MNQFICPYANPGLGGLQGTIGLSGLVHPHQITKALFPEAWPQGKVLAECLGSLGLPVFCRAGLPPLIPGSLTCHQSDRLDSTLRGGLGRHYYFLSDIGKCLRQSPAQARP